MHYLPVNQLDLSYIGTVCQCMHVSDRAGLGRCALLPGQFGGDMRPQWVHEDHAGIPRDVLRLPGGP